MTIQRSAGERLPLRAASVAAAALLLASLPLAAHQERSRPSDSSDTGRTAREAGPSSAPSYHPSAPSAPSPSYSPPSDSSSASSGRTARPTGPEGSEPHRQPPTRSSRGSRSHGGGYYGGYYSPYYYPYGYGFWPGLFWWWWGDGYDYYPYPYYRGDSRYYGRGDVGALDLDVYPGRTEVYVDGQPLGKVDAFDGWPRYLWLPKGTYDVVFYLDGYKTIARQITIYPGSVIDIDDRMEPGESVRPENLASKSHDRRDERLRYERERRDRIDRGERGDDDEDWRDRVRRERGAVRDRDRDDDDDADVEDIDVQEQTRGRENSGKGRLRLDVEPEDASVYLDGRFVGTGADLSQMRNGLPVTPGDHRLAIVRPGRKAEERQFQVKPGEEVELDVELEADSGR
jgi:hypothetical protein